MMIFAVMAERGCWIAAGPPVAVVVIVATRAQ